MKFSDRHPIYLQIAEFICDQVLLKNLHENERIPSVRELALQLKVNPNTVMRTYEYLQAKDIINNKRGVGYFVSKDGVATVTAIRKNEFLTITLPNIFKTSQLLNVPAEELLSRYKAFIKKNSP